MSVVVKFFAILLYQNNIVVLSYIPNSTLYQYFLNSYVAWIKFLAHRNFRHNFNVFFFRELPLFYLIHFHSFCSVNINI